MKILTVSVVIMVAMLAACGTGRSIINPEDESVLISSTSKTAPEWTIQGPQITDVSSTFIGLSPKCSSEPYARELAVRDALNQVALYFQTEVSAKYNETRARQHKGNSVATPNYIERFIAEQVSKVKAKPKTIDFYIERRVHTNDSGSFYLAYAQVEFDKIDLKALVTEAVSSVTNAEK